MTNTVTIFPPAPLALGSVHSLAEIPAAPRAAVESAWAALVPVHQAWVRSGSRVVSWESWSAVRAAFHSALAPWVGCASLVAPGLRASVARAEMAMCLGLRASVARAEMAMCLGLAAPGGPSLAAGLAALPR